MRVYVDPKRCHTIGACVQICPEIFRFHEGSKKAYAIINEVPPHLEDKCCEAAKACPQEAVIINE
jgi:ferredoxin